MEKFITDELVETTFLYCYKRVSNREQAEDLAQDIIFAALKAIRLGKTVENFHGWYWSLAKNKFIDFINHKNFPDNSSSVDFDTLLGDAAYDDRTIESLIKNEEYEKITYEISRLGKIHRDIIVRFYLKGETISQIAKDLNISEGTVKGRLFDARKNLYSRMDMSENIQSSTKKITEKSFLPVDFYFYGNSYAAELAIGDSLLVQQIIKVCNKKEKRINEIADEISASPVYIEENIESLLKAKILREVSKGKYISDVILIPHYELEKMHQLHDKIIIEKKLPEKYFQIFMQLKEKLLSFDFYGKDFNYNYLLWYFTIRCIKQLKDDASEYLVKNHTNQETAPRFENYDYSFNVDGFYYTEEDIKQNELIRDDILNNSITYGYYYQNFFNPKYGQVQIHDVYNKWPYYPEISKVQFRDFRAYLIHEGNFEMVLDLIKNPSMKLNENQEEAAAKLIEAGLITKMGDGEFAQLKVNIPLFNYSQIDEFCKIWSKEFSEWVKEFSEAMLPAFEKLFIPYVRKDLIAKFYIYTVRHFLCPQYIISDYGVKNGYLEIPEDDKCTAAGMCLLKSNEN